MRSASRSWEAAKDQGIRILKYVIPGAATAYAIKSTVSRVAAFSFMAYCEWHYLEHALARSHSWFDSFCEVASALITLVGAGIFSAMIAAFIPLSVAILAFLLLKYE